MYQLVKNSKKSKFIWADEHQCAFENIKTEIINAVTLAYPNSEDTFILDTDASDHCIGAELSQVQNGHERLISFASKVLTAEQRKYCTTRKEILAIITLTDNLDISFWVVLSSLGLTTTAWFGFLNFKNIEGQLARWIEEL